MSMERWGEGGVYLRGKTWWIRYSVNGKTIAESAKTKNQQEAQRVLRARLHERDSGNHVPDALKTTISELLGILRQTYVDRSRKTSREQCDILRAHVLDDESPLKFMLAARVGTDALKAYIAYRRKKRPDIANGTINRELSMLRRAYNLGAECDPPKVGRVPKMPMLPEAEARQGFFEPEMFERLIAQLPAYLGNVAKYAYLTGCRKGEIINMRWEWVNLQRREITLPPGATKTRKGRVIPLLPDMHALLSDMKAERDAGWPDSPWVFSHRGTRINENRMYYPWGKAVEAADLPEGVGLLHDFRRTAIRNLLRAGVSEAVVMAISGHRTRSMIDRYNIVSTEDLHEAARKLDRYLKEQRLEAQGLLRPINSRPAVAV